jgi:hypothetical protein
MSDPDFIGPPTSTDLAQELLFGELKSDPTGWYPKREYPTGERREMAYAALAYELRREAPDGHFVGLVAAMYDPHTEGVLPRLRIELKRGRGRKGEARVIGRRGGEIAEFLHVWRAAHPDETDVASAIDAAEKHFGLAGRIIWDVWAHFGERKPNDPPSPYSGMLPAFKNYVVELWRRALG